MEKQTDRQTNKNAAEHPTHATAWLTTTGRDGYIRELTSPWTDQSARWLVHELATNAGENITFHHLRWGGE